MNKTIKIAYHLPSKKYIHIDDADNGLACNCKCIECNERLEAIQGKIRINHFRHHTNLDCNGSQESALHELGKQILIENQQINIPKYGEIIYSNPIAEKQLESIRPDILAKIDNQNIIFEIFVTHAVDSEKEKFLINNELNSIEIDLRGAEKSKYSEIKRLVLEEISNKRIIFWNKVESPENSTEVALNKPDSPNSTGELIFKICIGVILGIAAFFGLRKIWHDLSNKKYINKKYYKRTRYYRVKNK